MRGSVTSGAAEFHGVECANPQCAIRVEELASSKSMPPRCSTPSGCPMMRKPCACFSQNADVELAAPEVCTPRPWSPGERRVCAAYWVAAASDSVRVTASGTPARVRDCEKRSRTVGAPARRVGQHDQLRRSTFPLRSGGHHPPEKRRGQRLGRVGLSCDQDGHGIADPTLEQPHHAIRFSHSPPLRRLTTEERAVLLPRSAPTAPWVPGFPAPRLSARNRHLQPRR